MYKSLFGDTNYTPDKDGLLKKDELLKLEAQLMFVDRLYIANFGDYIANAARRAGKTTEIEAYLRVSSSIVYLMRCILDKIEVGFFVKITKELNEDGVSSETIISISAEIDALAKAITIKLKVKNGTGPVSFLSKFVHFTTGISPIYDANAEKGIKRLFEVKKRQKYTCEEYARIFCILLKLVYPDVEKYTKEMIKDLEGYLYDIGREGWRFGEGP